MSLHPKSAGLFCDVPVRTKKRGLKNSIPLVACMERVEAYPLLTSVELLDSTRCVLHYSDGTNRIFDETTVRVAGRMPIGRPHWEHWGLTWSEERVELNGVWVCLELGGDEAFELSIPVLRVPAPEA